MARRDGARAANARSKRHSCAKRARPGIGGQQQLPEHAAADLQQPGAEHRLRRLHAGIAAPYLGRLLPGERVAEPLMPSVPEGAPVPAAGLASQIASLTSTIRSASDANSW